MGESKIKVTENLRVICLQIYTMPKSQAFCVSGVASAGLVGPQFVEARGLY